MVEPDKKSKLEQINEAAKSLEIREAEAEVSSDDIAITPAEQREIDAMAESESERAELTDELVEEKRQREVVRIAREKVNEAVPTRHVVQRPSFGPIHGSAEYHMRNTYMFLLGRGGSSDKSYIAGLFQAAADTRKLVQGYIANCPYAAWYLIQIEELISEIRKKTKSVETDAQALVNHATTISLAPFVSKRPAIVPLDFRVSYAFHYADLLTHYDRILRLVKSYELQHFITHKDFIDIEAQLGTPLRRLFRLPSQWSFVGKDAVAQQTSTFLAAEHRMGILPDDIRDGLRKPSMV